MSRGLYPQELAACEIWWKGLDWLQLPQEEWPEVPQLIERLLPIEENEPSLKVVLLAVQAGLPLLERISSYTKLKHVTAWISTLSIVPAQRKGVAG